MARHQNEKNADHGTDILGPSNDGGREARTAFVLRWWLDSALRVCVSDNV